MVTEAETGAAVHKPGKGKDGRQPPKARGRARNSGPRSLRRQRPACLISDFCPQD